jgi:hypothetical protein
MINQIHSHYRIIEKLDAEAMAVVYKLGGYQAGLV